MAAPEVTGDEIALTVNGLERRIPAGWTLSDLLASLALDPRVVVIEHNGVILRDRSTFDSIPLVFGETLEIVHFVGGG